MSVSFNFHPGTTCPDALSASFQLQTRLKLCITKADNYFRIYAPRPRYLIGEPLHEVVKDCYEIFHDNLGEDLRNVWYPVFLEYLHKLRRIRKDSIDSYYCYIRTVDFIYFQETLEANSEDREACNEFLSISEIALHLN